MILWSIKKIKENKKNIRIRSGIQVVLYIDGPFTRPEWPPQPGPLTYIVEGLQLKEKEKRETIMRNIS